MAGDAGSFIEPYLLVTNPASFTIDSQLWLAGVVMLMNAVICGGLVYRLRLYRPMQAATRKAGYKSPG
jgi:hypothetical protein